MDNTQTFTQYRPFMFSIAYRMLGSVVEAEDIVQDAFLRWRETAEEEIRSPKSYLATIVTRLSIDRLRSAQIQRESYIGPWLPEPLISEKGKSTAEIVSTAEHISMAFLVLLEKLSPVERAVFLLREVFDYDYAGIAEIVDKSEANCRQIARRARQQVDTGHGRFDASPESACRNLHRHSAKRARYQVASAHAGGQYLQAVLHALASNSFDRLIPRC